MNTSSPKATEPAGTSVIVPPPGLRERALAACLRGMLRCSFKTMTGPPFGVGLQRTWVNFVSLSVPGRAGVTRQTSRAAGVPVEITLPESGRSTGVILYLHGGAFCLGSPLTHHGITSHLAVESGMAVWTPDYRLAPEHPYPAGLDDVTAVYRHLLTVGYAPGDIVLAGDSAGATLALALAIQLRDQQQPAPGGLALISPVTDPTLQGPTIQSRSKVDPMLRLAWIRQGLGWYRCPIGTASHQPLSVSLHGLPAMLIHVGDQEMLLSDSTRLASLALQAGVDCTIEIYLERWHVFHLQSFYLRSSVLAIQSIAAFARQRLDKNTEAGKVAAVAARAQAYGQ